MAVCPPAKNGKCGSVTYGLPFSPLRENPAGVLSVCVFPEEFVLRMRNPLSCLAGGGGGRGRWKVRNFPTESAEECGRNIGRFHVEVPHFFLMGDKGGGMEVRT